MYKSKGVDRCALYRSVLPGMQGELGAHVGRETSGKAADGREGGEGRRWGREGGSKGSKEEKRDGGREKEEKKRGRKGRSE